LYLVNRGSLLAPFHNMMLVSPETSVEQINRLITNLDACAQTLLGKSA
jgi:glutamate-1-semialdehyde 2,1-aminomutase